MIEHDADGTTLYSHVFEDKGCKITVKFNILDGPSTELERQLSRVNQAVKEVVEIKSACDRLGVSVTYLQGLLEIGDVEKDVSHSSQTRPPTDDKYLCRSTR